MAEPRNYELSRTPQGHFGPKNPGGPGGPGRRRELLRAIENVVTPAHMEAMVRKAMQMGLTGSIRALEFVVALTIGRPRQAPPEVTGLDIKFESIRTSKDCTVAIGRTLGGIRDGQVGAEVGRLLIEGLKALMKIFEHEEATAAANEPSAPRPNDPSLKMLRTWFWRFRTHGVLPEDTADAEDVLDILLQGYTVAPDFDVNGTGFTGFVKQPVPCDDYLIAVITEAVRGTWIERSIARNMLQGWAKIGFDLTGPVWAELDVPEFGSVTLHTVGWAMRFPKRPHRSRGKWLFERSVSIMRQPYAEPESYYAWRDRVGDAAQAFQLRGELPKDDHVFDAVMLLGEVVLVARQIAGQDVEDVLSLVRKVNNTAGPERDPFIAELQVAARMGRLIG